MIRRKLFAYTIMLAAGISAGFFIFEKSRLFSGVMVMVTTAAAVCLYSMREDHGTISDAEISPDAFKLIAVLAAGFLIFTCRYIHYERILMSGTAAAVKPDITLSGKAEAAGEQEVTGDTADCYSKVTGEVLSVRITEKGMRLEIRPLHGRCKVLINYYDEDIVPPAELIGTEITAFGRYREPPGADNPGCFDYRTYLRSRGTGFLFFARSIFPAEEDSDEGADGSGGQTEDIDYSGSGEQNADYDDTDHYGSAYRISARGRYRRHMFLIREKFLAQIEDEDIRAFITGVVFGDKSQIDEEIRDDFNMNGTGHILAVSGLHTGFLYALLRFLAGKRRTLGLSVLVIMILLMYGEMTMWSPSTMRSVTVLSISLLSVYVRRPFDLLSSVSAAAFLILVMEPYQLMSSGFQMSFMAMLGIAFLTGPLAYFTGDAMAVMLAVQIGVAPLTAFIFHRLNLLSVFINIPIIFIASVLVPLCMCALFITAAAGTGIGVLTSVIEGLAELTIGLNRAAADPFSLTGQMHESTASNGSFSIQTTAVNAGLLILFYLILLLASSEWCRVRLIRKEYLDILFAMICAASVSVCFMAATFNQFADDEIVFVSVGQGDCTHIRAKGSTSGILSLFMSGSGGRSDADDSCNILIDGGGTAERDIGKDTLMPYLLANGAGRVELALTTHLHSDHFLGLLQLNKVYPVGAVGVPDDYRRSIEKMKSRSSYEDRNSAITGKTQYSSEDNDSTITNNSTNTNTDRASNDDDSSIESINDLRDPGSGSLKMFSSMSSGL